MAPGFIERTLRFRKLRHRRKTSYEATQRVLHTYELLEHILTLVDNPEALRQARLVNELWCTTINKNRQLDKRWRPHLTREISIVMCSDDTISVRALTEAWCYSHWVDTYDPTGDDSRRKMLVVGGLKCIVDLKDFPGINSEWWQIHDQMMRDADAYVLAYSVDSRSSFDAAVEWQRQLDTPGESLRERIMHQRAPRHRRGKRPWDPTRPYLLGVIATDREAEPERVEVEKREGEELASRLQCPFHEVSVKDRTNLDQSPTDLVREYSMKPMQREE